MSTLGLQSSAHKRAVNIATIRYTAFSPVTFMISNSAPLDISLMTVKIH